MSVIRYPAVFHRSDDSGYWIEFPDLPGCLTEGEDEIDAYEMAKDALSLYLDTSNDLYERTFAAPSSCASILMEYPGELVMLIEVEPDHYARKYKTRAIKKTLTIPEWLNEKAVKADINFSQLLQEAIKEKLNLD